MDSQGVTRPVGGLFAKLKAAPPWVWISIILGAGVLVVSWMIYRNQAAANATGTNPAGQGTVPADGTGQPLWSTADTSGMQTGNWQDLQNLLAYLQSQQTPNPPGVAPPGGTITTPPILAPGPSGGVNPPTSGGSAAQYFTITQNYSTTNRATTTLSGIAGLYHTSVAALLKLNPNITNPNLVYKGEKIRVK